MIHWRFLNGEYTETVCFVKLTWHTAKSWFILRGSFIQHLLLAFFFSLRQNVLSPLFRSVFCCFSVYMCSLLGDYSEPAMKWVPPRKTSYYCLHHPWLNDLYIWSGNSDSSPSCSLNFLFQITCIKCILYLELFCPDDSDTKLKW